MNIKKLLKNQADLEKQKILADSDKQAYEEMLAQIKSDPKPKSHPHLSKWLAAAAGVCASAIVLVCVLVFYPFNKTNVYLNYNFITDSSTTDEMDNDMKAFKFETLNDYSVLVDKTVDSVSGDTIYYTARFYKMDSLIKFEIVAVCNKNYTYSNFKFEGDSKQMELSGYPVNYQKDILPDSEFNLPLMNCKAQIQKDGEFLYITNYSEYMLDEEGSFFKIIQEMLI